MVRRARNGAYVLKDATGDLLDRHVPADQLKILAKVKRAAGSANTDDVYEVESIITHRGDAPAYDYRVRWKGYSADDDSWEPASAFLDSRIINEYWKRHAQQNE